MRHALLAIHIGVATTAIGSAATLTETFSSFYSFGDSLTDDGKAGSGVFNPLSDGGRFSNGPTYAELIAGAFESAGLDTGNLALGGATAGDTNLNGFSDLSTFGGQIGAFGDALDNNTGLPLTADLSVTSANAPNPGAEPLVSVFFGGNDLLQMADPIAAADAVAAGILEIAALSGGGLFDNFVVLDQGDVGATPFAASFGASAALTAATNAFNGQLQSNLGALSAQGLNIISFDTSNVFDEIEADIAAGGTQYGILDATVPCTADISDPLAPSCLDLGQDPNTLFFNDAVHPNAVVQATVGDAVIQAVNAAVTPVPVPASMPLLLVGAGAIGALRLRKRAA